MLLRNVLSQFFYCQIYILPAKFATVNICLVREWLYKRAQAKYAITAFNSPLVIVYQAANAERY